MVNEEMDMFMIISHLKIFNIKKKSHFASISLLYTNSFLLTMFSDKICYFHFKKKFQMIYTFFWFRLFFPDMLYIKESNISECDTQRVLGVWQKELANDAQAAVMLTSEFKCSWRDKQKRNHKNILARKVHIV